MFIIRNIPEQKYFVDIKHVTVIPDSVPELAHSMLKSFTPQTGITIEEENSLHNIIYQWIFLSQSVAICMWSMWSNFDATNKLHTFLSKKQYLNIPEHIIHRSHNRDQIITIIKDTKSRASCVCFTLILHIYLPIWLHHVLRENNEHLKTSDGRINRKLLKFNYK